MAVTFGGLDKNSRPTSQCVFFDPKVGWRKQDPAGTRPPRSAGHSAAYDPATYTMMVFWLLFCMRHSPRFFHTLRAYLGMSLF